MGFSSSNGSHFNGDRVIKCYNGRHSTNIMLCNCGIEAGLFQSGSSATALSNSSPVARCFNLRSPPVVLTQLGYVLGVGYSFNGLDCLRAGRLIWVGVIWQRCGIRSGKH